MKKIVFSIVALLALAFSASAQESLVEIPPLKGTTTIIRMIGDDDWLVYCKDTSCRFLRVTNGNVTADEMILEPYFTSVTDFKIHEGRVYFCGMAEDGLPYMANFSIGSFPSTSFEWEYLAKASSVNKLEVYGSSNSVIHIVMTGQDLSGYGILVEAMSMGIGWHVYYTMIYAKKGEEFVFDDIAISDTLAAVTSYEREGRYDSLFAYTYHSGRVWFIRVPSLITVPLTNSPVQHVEVPYTVSSPCAVIEAEPNSFVVATSGKTEGENVFVSGFIGKNHYATVTLPYIYRVADICYNNANRSTEIILNMTKSIFSANEMFTLLPGMAITPGTAYGHRFDNYYMKSLAYQFYNPNHFIGVGFAAGPAHTLSLAEYHCSSVATCALHTSIKTGVFEWYKAPRDGMKQTVDEILAQTGRDAGIYYKTLDTICFKRHTENE